MWVSVKERLPEEPGLYRVKRKPVKNAIARVEEAWFEPAYGEKGVWLSRREVRIRTVDEWLEVREEEMR